MTDRTNQQQQSFSSQTKGGRKIMGKPQITLSSSKASLFLLDAQMVSSHQWYQGKCLLPSSLPSPPPKEGGSEMEVNCLLCERHLVFQTLVRGVGCGAGDPLESNRKHNPCGGI